MTRRDENEPRGVTAGGSGHVRNPYQRGEYTVETVYVGSAGHLRRYKVLDAQGKYVPGGLFRTTLEANAFIRDRA